MDQRFGPYQVGETIGRGTFAKVKVAVHEATKTKVALKVIPRKVVEEDPKSEVKIKREIKILQILRHPHVMRLYDVVQTKHDIILVLEYVSGGELFDFISRRGRLHENLARLFFQQLIAAVGYCHTYNVAHRDLKPENILLEQNMKSIKIGDFGLSSIMRDGKLFETSCGTPNYAAPEVVSGRLYNGREADVWSCGVVLYTMLAGGLPFDDPYVNILFKKIQSASYQIPSFVPKGAQDIIARMLVPDPLERATIEQIVQHPWVREQFPNYLVVIHTEALYQAGRFASEARRAIAEQLDVEVVNYVAARFRLPAQRVVGILENAEGAEPTESESARLRRLHHRLIEDLYSVVDEKTKPEPLVIPLAEEKLRDEEHDVVISYSILLDRKLMRKSISDGSPPSGHNSKHVDPTAPGSGQNSDSPGNSGGGGGGKAVHDHAATASALSCVAQSSSMIAKMGAASASTLEYGSLRGLSLGPHSHKPMTAASRAAPGHLQRAPDGTMHFSPLFVNSQAPAPFVDVYLAGYNKLSVPCLEVSKHGAKTLLGAFFGLQEVCVDDIHMLPLHPTQTQQRGAVSDAAAAAAAAPPAPPKREPLLKPLLAPQVDGPGGEGASSTSTSSKADTSAHQVTATSNTSTTSVRSVTEGHLAGRFGADFMRNGVLFCRTDAQSVFSELCRVLRTCGMMWKTLHAFCVVAQRHSGDKLMCKIFKIDNEDYLVDVRVSVLCGMDGLECATEVLLELLARANQKTFRR